jgi:hypothetical protein
VRSPAEPGNENNNLRWRLVLNIDHDTATVAIQSLIY